MATKTEKEIEALSTRLEKLKAQQAKEEQQKQALETTQQSILDVLQQAGLSLDDFIIHNIKVARRVVARLDKAQKKGEESKQAVTVKKKTVKKRRRVRAKAKPSIKIPAGRYGNLPDNPDQIIVVKEKGPRPKVLKAYAEEIGLDNFLEKCRMEE
ncbi:hypothetical protein QQ73_04800 [Candidatus Endoriftia persephone str. Guaymas]|jgi:mannitol-specific phosphotransferase system IIBC component|uniref:Uncharacterized protein n=3 Tax=Gammaproteobacteria TaxID=1236 RepID=G2FGK3_9GAMM|nr:hypothetical protein [Candidatus Endoriftia persephone]EGV52924.1 hypothetical protein Rifp1Sym_aa00820 [endosymbiont of Riftia pachyptila (vent Ph05)]EGW54114.1 hypothetical protein TevJSym_aq00620 [endosymbiont of Tevnia jerichonana (vent Tica)]MBA1330508.1 hypothetical protein [Candidatus Endoriftia persephone str. Guaymas]USF87631.1 hypothetical protein L0Y14_16165 [Candidatus Endoriftia persephone]